MKARVQHPQVKPRKDRPGWPWVFRYRADEIQPDGSVKTLRKYQEIGPSKGDGAITKKQAEIERDKFLAKLNAPTRGVAVQQVAAPASRFSARWPRCTKRDIWAARTRSPGRHARKKSSICAQYIVPRWGESSPQPDPAEGGRGLAPHDFRFMVDDARRSRDHEPYLQLRRGPRACGRKANAARQAERSSERSATSGSAASFRLRRPPACSSHLEEPNRLIIETCIATGARISEVLGLKWKHVNLTAGTIKIEQRVWHQDIGRPKSEDSRRVLGIGDLVRALRA